MCIFKANRLNKELLELLRQLPHETPEKSLD